MAPQSVRQLTVRTLNDDDVDLMMTMMRRKAGSEGADLSQTSVMSASSFWDHVFVSWNDDGQQTQTPPTLSRLGKVQRGTWTCFAKQQPYRAWQNFLNVHCLLFSPSLLFRGSDPPLPCWRLTMFESGWRDLKSPPLSVCSPRWSPLPLSSGPLGLVCVAITRWRWRKERTREARVNDRGPRTRAREDADGACVIRRAHRATGVVVPGVPAPDFTLILQYLNTILESSLGVND